MPTHMMNIRTLRFIEIHPLSTEITPHALLPDGRTDDPKTYRSPPTIVGQRHKNNRMPQINCCFFCVCASCHVWTNKLISTHFLAYSRSKGIGIGLPCIMR